MPVLGALQLLPENSKGQEMSPIMARLVLLRHSGLDVHRQGEQLQTCLVGSR